jgi:CDGSH-type Zn-finger protein
VTLDEREQQTTDRRAPEVIECLDGPLLVRGATSVRDRNDDVHLVTRPLVALCRCDKSSRLPWCDGTHKLLNQQPGSRPTVFAVAGQQLREETAASAPRRTPE